MGEEETFTSLTARRCSGSLCRRFLFQFGEAGERMRLQGLEKPGRVSPCGNMSLTVPESWFQSNAVSN